MNGKITVFIPGQANMVKASLARLIEIRHKPPMDRLTDERFAALVESARGWLAKAEAIAERAMHDDLARDAYWLYCREADRAIFTARDEPFAQAGSRERAKQSERAARPRGNPEFAACVKRAKASPGSATDQWQKLEGELERSGFKVRDHLTDSGGLAYNVEAPDGELRQYTLKTFQNQK